MSRVFSIFIIINDCHLTLDLVCRTSAYRKNLLRAIKCETDGVVGRLCDFRSARNVSIDGKPYLIDGCLSHDWSDKELGDIASGLRYDCEMVAQLCVDVFETSRKYRWKVIRANLKRWPHYCTKKERWTGICVAQSGELFIIRFRIIAHSLIR